MVEASFLRALYISSKVLLACLCFPTELYASQEQKLMCLHAFTYSMFISNSEYWSYPLEKLLLFLLMTRHFPLGLEKLLQGIFESSCLFSSPPVSHPTASLIVCTSQIMRPSISLFLHSYHLSPVSCLDLKIILLWFPMCEIRYVYI